MVDRDFESAVQQAATTEQSRRSGMVKQESPVELPPIEDGMTRTLLPINERFTLYFDEEGDVIIECQRPNQFLASHGSTANEAVLEMRETLQLAASMRRPIAVLREKGD